MHTTLFFVDKEDYLPFLNWLSRLSGKQWLDIDKEREQAIHEIENRSGEAFYIKILNQSPKGAVAISTIGLLVLPVELHGETQLFLFRGEVKPKNLAAILPVTHEWSDNKCVNDSEVLYNTCDDRGCDLEAILLPTASYHVTLANPSPVVPGAPAKTDCAKLHDQQLSFKQPINDSGQPTLKKRD